MSTSRALQYLRHEVTRERHEVERVIEDPLQRARALDMLQFFDRRLDAAVLIDRQDRQEAQA
jgi:hypothetical protein